METRHFVKPFVKHQQELAQDQPFKRRKRIRKHRLFMRQAKCLSKLLTSNQKTRRQRGQEIILNKDPVSLVHDFAPLLGGEARDDILVVVGGIRSGLELPDEVEMGAAVEPVDRHRAVSLPLQSAETFHSGLEFN